MTRAPAGDAAVTVLGMDIGGTRSRAELVHNGRTVHRVEGSSASPVAVGEDLAAAALGRMLEALPRPRAAGSADALPSLDAVCVGVAGSEAAGTVGFISRLLAPYVAASRLRIVSDADLILPAADLRDGVAVVAGTGAVAVGRRGPDDVKAGGWGYLLGDEGSGYWLVRAAVRQLLRGHERGDRPTPLLAALLDSTGTRDLAQLVQHLYHSPRPASWARHAPAVLDSAGTDPAAQTVLDGAADALAGIALSSVRRLGGDLPVVLAGGILTNHAMLADAVHARLSTTEVAEVSTLLAEPVAGAVKLAAALVTADGDTTQ